MKPGDKVKITLKDNSIKEGIIMPSKDDTLILKLNSGYNLGINKTKIKETKQLKKEPMKKQDKINFIQDKTLKRVTILHTGGTISSKVDYETGAVSSKFKPEEIITMFPELKRIVNLDSRLISNMFSDDMNFSHYNILAKEIIKEIKKGVNGIIITHGTDTLHYTSAALSFILEHINIPILLVGAQRSSDRGSSDASLNLIAACNFIKETNFVGVAICMHANTNDNVCAILHGCKVRKMHTSRRDAFRSINTDSIATVDEYGKIVYQRDYSKKHDQKLNLKLFNENLKVGIIKIHTHMSKEQFEVYKNFDGLVIEGTGLGHTPENVLEEIQKLKIPIVMSSQCIYGRINMNIYSKGRHLQELNVLGNFCDMTPETSFIKLSWLISNHKDNLKHLFETNLRGEINPKTVFNEDFQK